MRLIHPVRSSLVMLSFLTFACPGPTKIDTGSESGDTDTDTDETDTNDTAGPDLCEGGNWSGTLEPDTTYYVCTDGSDDGDGSISAPFLTIAVALDAARADPAGSRTIAIGPGEFYVNLVLAPETNDDGISFLGSGTDATVLEADSSSEPLFLISGATGIVLQGMSTRGGQPGIQAWSAGEITLTDVSIDDAQRAGVLVHGSGTQASLNQVRVTNAQPVDGHFGYGISFQTEAAGSATGIEVSGCTAAGLLVDNVTSFSLLGADISGTVSDGDGFMGRGIQVQESVLDEVRIEGANLEGNADAGLFASGTTSLSLVGNFISGTMPALVPDVAKATTGDGIVVTRGPENLNPTWFISSITGNEVSGSERAGIILDGVSYTASENVLDGNNYDGGSDVIVVQGGAIDGGSTGDFEQVKEGLAVNQELVEPVTIKVK